MQQCINQEALADHAKRQNNIQTKQAIGMAMAGMGAGMQNAAAAQTAARPTYCTSTPSSTWVGNLLARSEPPAIETCSTWSTLNERADRRAGWARSKS